MQQEKIEIPQNILKNIVISKLNGNLNNEFEDNYNNQIQNEEAYENNNEVEVQDDLQTYEPNYTSTSTTDLLYLTINRE